MGTTSTTTSNQKNELSSSKSQNVDRKNNSTASTSISSSTSSNSSTVIGNVTGGIKKGSDIPTLGLETKVKGNKSSNNATNSTMVTQNVVQLNDNILQESLKDSFRTDLIPSVEKGVSALHSQIAESLSRSLSVQEKELGVCHRLESAITQLAKSQVSVKNSTVDNSTQINQLGERIKTLEDTVLQLVTLVKETQSSSSA